MDKTTLSEPGFLALIENELSADWKRGYAKIEAFLKTFPQRKMTIRHRFYPGIMCREIFIPADTLLMGASYKYSHPVFMTQGYAVCFTPKLGLQYLRPSDEIETLPDNPRIGYVFEDVIWTNVLRNPRNLEDPREVMEDACHDAHKLQ